MFQKIHPGMGCHGQTLWTDMVAQKVKPLLDTPNERLVGCFFKTQRGQSPVHTRTACRIL